MPRRGMDDKPARLVDDNHVVILVDNGKRDILRHSVDGGGLLRGELDGFIPCELEALARRFAVDKHAPFLDGLRRRRARQLFERAGEKSVEPRAAVFFTCLQQDRFHRSCSPGVSRRIFRKRRGNK